ncbi:Amidohydrolase [Candidatus Magnetomoraceae bacterium gMMP-15]
MIIDFHTHIFPSEICNNREKYFDGEPAFELLYSPPKSKLIQADDIVEAMDSEAVDISVVFGFPWKKADTFKKNNDHIIEAVNKYPDRLKGFCCVDPFNPESQKEAERCLNAGLSGIGELAFYESGIDEECIKKLKPLMDICLERDLPVMIHTNEPVGHLYPGKTPNTLSQIYNLIKTFPKNKIVLAHWGGGIFFFYLLKKEAKEVLTNVYFDTAASLFLYDSQIYNIACNIIGSKKILFGSDFPLIKPKRYFKQINETGLSGKAIKNICGNNAARLLGI